MSNTGMIMDSKFGSFVVQKAFIFTVSKYFYAFVAPNPILRGHVLISSKREVSLLSELYNEELFDYSLFLQKISVILEAIYKVSSFTISVQDGYKAGQNIFHFHAHIIPRFPNDFERNDIIYERLKSYDDEFIKVLNDNESLNKYKLERKPEVDKLKEYVNLLSYSA